MITQAEVKQLFSYKDGELIRKTYSSSNAKPGEAAGTVHSKGYRITVINKKPYQNHRLVWLWWKGYLPENPLDHIDRNRLNNRIENLREVSRQCNARNANIRIDSPTGINGITRQSGYKHWKVQIRVDGHTYYLGSFRSFSEAVATRLAHEQALDWAGCDSSSAAFMYIRQIQEACCTTQNSVL